MAEKSELDALEAELLQAGDIWFNQTLHRKLQRLIEIAREGQKMRADALHQVIDASALNINPVAIEQR